MEIFHHGLFVINYAVVFMLINFGIMGNASIKKYSKPLFCSFSTSSIKDFPSANFQTHHLSYIFIVMYYSVRKQLDDDLI